MVGELNRFARGVLRIRPEKISRHRRKKRIVLKNSFGIVGLRRSTDSQEEGQDDAGKG